MCSACALPDQKLNVVQFIYSGSCARGSPTQLLLEQRLQIKACAASGMVHIVVSAMDCGGSAAYALQPGGRAQLYIISLGVLAPYRSQGIGECGRTRLGQQSRIEVVVGMMACKL